MTHALPLPPPEKDLAAPRFLNTYKTASSPSLCGPTASAWASRCTVPREAQADLCSRPRGSPPLAL